MLKMKKIAVIPAYNEEDRISDVISNTKKYVDEIIVVDDGSVDDTLNKANKANFKARHIVNMGKGCALKTGFKAALDKGADIIITLDADGQHDPKEIPKLINFLKENDLDAVVGYRSENPNMPSLFKFGNNFINKALKMLFDLNVRDSQSGFRVYKVESCKDLSWNSIDYAVETEMLINLKKLGLKCGEVPIKTTYHDRYKGTTIIDGLFIFLRMLYWKMGGK